MRFPTDAALVGTYGGHSDASRAAARAYDATGVVVDADSCTAPPLWLCGHFAAKALAPLLEDARRDAEHHGGRDGGGAAAPAPVLLWQTKSVVQPRGEADEWAAMRAMPNAVRAWADSGAAESARRPGKVDTRDGGPADYRHLMTPLPPSPPEATGGGRGGGTTQTA